METISSYTKEVDGKSVPMWNNEEVKEIVIAQVYCDSEIIFQRYSLHMFLFILTYNLNRSVASFLTCRLRYNCHYFNKHNLWVVKTFRSAGETLWRDN